MKKKVLASMIVGIALFLLSSGCMPRKVTLVKVLEGGDLMVGSLSFSPDGKFLASGSRPVKVWDISTWETVWQLDEPPGGSFSLSFSPDGKLLACEGRRGAVLLWDVATQKSVATIQAEESFIASLAFSPDGKLLVTGGEQLRLWDVATRELVATLVPTLKGDLDYVTSVAFSSDSVLLASGTFYGAIDLWDVATKKCLQTLKKDASFVDSVAFSPDGRTLAAAKMWLQLWDVPSGKHIAEVIAAHGPNAVAFSPDGSLLASADDDRRVRFLDSRWIWCVNTLERHDAPIICIAFSPDGKLFASGDENGIIRIWEIN